jgi:carbon storage regulator CsrA
MLILSRKIGAGLVLYVGGERILIEVRDVIGSQVRIGVEADRERVKVLRTELEARDAIEQKAVGAV